MFTWSGIELREGKQMMVYRRLAGRIESLGLRGFSEYLGRIDTDVAEREVCVNLLTTNLTSFFREPAHFTMLAQEVLPERIAANAERRRLRIWSAGCATGEEPWSLAMVVAETLPDLAHWDVRILATDINSNALEVARTGSYSLRAVEGVSTERLHRWFLRGRGDNEGWVTVRPELRRLVTFKPLNLIEPWPMRGPLDVIFFRNVSIYFDRQTGRDVQERMHDLLAPGGYLMVGHSEVLLDLSGATEWLGNTTYRKAMLR